MTGDGVGILRGEALPPTSVIVDYISEHRAEFGMDKTWITFAVPSPRR